VLKNLESFIVLLPLMLELLDHHCQNSLRQSLQRKQHCIRRRNATDSLFFILTYIPKLKIFSPGGALDNSRGLARSARPRLFSGRPSGAGAPNFGIRDNLVFGARYRNCVLAPPAAQGEWVDSLGLGAIPNRSSCFEPLRCQMAKRCLFERLTDALSHKSVRGLSRCLFLLSSRPHGCGDYLTPLRSFIMELYRACRKTGRKSLPSNWILRKEYCPERAASRSPGLAANYAANPGWWRHANPTLKGLHPDATPSGLTSHLHPFPG
jgi:hypothetical protein